ncbi:MAG: helix-turn-helix domain-containing protein [Prevotella sp.]|nr:helix-turn-helix domain-containing protein [Prevotella sp.]MBP5507079.1 helix-turn-helix domain-containing protein [Prevotella sp.]
MKPKFLFCVLLMSFLPYLRLHAQMGKLFDADNQLSSSFTNQVYLDRDGFIWTATRNGLSRYDGYQHRIYKKENGIGMASNYVNCILQDSKGLFYVGMYGALQTYDGTAFKDVKVTDLNGHEVFCYVTSFVERKSGEIMVGTSGHGLLQMESQEKAFQVNGDLRNVESILQMMEDSKGRLWLVTDRNGLLVYDKGKVVTRYFQDEAMRSNLLTVCEDNDGRIYVGVTKQGLFRLDGNTFNRIENSEKESVTALYCDNDGRIMVGYDGAGLGIYDPQNGSMIANPYFSREVDLSLAKIVSISEDLGGNVWLGIRQKGVYMQPVEQTDFNYMGNKLGTRNLIGQACVTSTLIDSKKRIWIGTDKDGLYQLSEDKQLVRHHKANVPSTILALSEDHQGRVWLGSYQDGCGWMDEGSNYHPQSLPQGAHVSVFDVGSDSKGNIWLATMGNGLIHIASDGAITAYTMKKGADTDRKINSLPNDYISKMTIAEDGKKVFLATTVGVCCYDTEKKSWTSVFGGNCLNFGTPTRIVKQYGGNLWIGTNDGLLCYDFKTRELKRFGTDDGLSDNGIASIEQDKTGRLWLSTDHGLCCFDPKTKKTTNYFVDNGLQSNEFSDGASWFSPAGTMAFGGVGGITWFDPMKLQPTEWKTSVKLTAFLINGNPVDPSTKSGHYQVCKKTVISCDRFNLSYRDNSFAIQLSTLTYDNPEHITYFYSINGEPFVRLQPGQNEITFSHLSPGTYKFRIKAERNAQQTAERTFTVVVHSPWFKTWWAYCLYIALIAAAIWQYVKMRNRQEQDKLRLQEHIHAEEMGEAKLRFFMNISHEIRTPMTLILTPLLTLMKQDDDPHRRNVYVIIKRNAERILSLINQLMDLRKIDKGMMQMRMSETDMVAFINDIHTLFEHQARAKNVNFVFEHEEKELPVWIDRRQFDKVIVNILSNAFKFTPSGGNINIKLKHDAEHATIAISDDGEHIPEDKLEHIFKRFYQTASSVNDTNTGTGIGLDLTRSLVELHHGTIIARNLDKGCEFVVTIPLGNKHLREDEIMSAEETETHTLMAHDLEELMPDEPMAEQSLSGRPSIVLAEDDDEIREYLCEILNADYDVRACADGREALAEALKSLPDLVISDIMMPKMDGNTLSATLKTNPQTSHIPIILLTAKNRDDDKLEGLETGADAYIVKPFNLDILKRTIANLINSRRQLQLKFGRNDQLESQVEEVALKSPDEKLLERVMKVINQNISNSDLSVDSIAAEVGISRVHLHRKMKELTGQTPHDFIRNIRLKQAARLLSNGDMNVTEVMYACGFSNLASFSTIFKKFYGMTPREYKK